MNRKHLIYPMAVVAALILQGAKGAGVLDDAYRGLSSEERIAFVRSVNAMMPNFGAETKERRIETTYLLNRDLIKAAPVIERRRILAEVFATAPVDVLPSLADGLATTVFNRSSAGYGKDDDVFQNFALSAMLSIYRRCRADNNLELSNQRRIAFAVIMFLKASEGDPDDFLDQLIAFVPDVAREMALNDWIPCAMGKDGQKPTYEPILQAGTNDQEVAKGEIRDDERRITLKFPRSEQEVARRQMLDDIRSSPVLILPDFDDIDEIPRHIRVQPKPEPKEEPRQCLCPCPPPYEGQSF